MLNHILLLFTLLIIGIGSTEAQETDEKILNIFNWSEYFAPDTISKFEQETGITVRYDTYDSDEALDAKLVVGKTGYDIVFPGNAFLATQVQAGVHRPIERQKLDNYKHLDNSLLKIMSKSDPDNAHSVPYMWGTIGVAFDRKKIAGILGKDMPSNVLDLIFNPAYAARLQKCGIGVMDSANGVLPLAIDYIGRDPVNPSAADYLAATEMLNKVRPFIRQFVTDPTPKGLIDGDICITIAYNGAALVAAKLARESATGADIVYQIPSSGAPLWFDSMAIPKDAPHSNNAHKFINFILRPDIVATISDAVQYASANKTAQSLVSESLRKNTAIYPDDKTRATLWVQASKSLEQSRIEAREWTRFKTGH